MRLNSKVTYQNDGSTEFWTLGSRFLGEAEGSNVAGGVEKACTFPSDGQSYAAQQYERKRTKTEATRESTADLTPFGKVSGLLQMSPDAPCQVGKEAQRLYVKYPLHKEVEPGTSFIAETRGTSSTPHGR